MKDASAAYGEYICGSVNCKDTSNGNDYKNGASWCYYDEEGNPDTASVGSRHYRHICYMGEEIFEPCSDLRQEVCVETAGEDSEFPQAGCAPNRYLECIFINNTQDCLNSDLRDCKWIPFNLLLGAGEADNFIDKERLLAEAFNVRTEGDDTGKCVPNVAPGFQFWAPQAENNCNVGSFSCVVKYEKGLISGKECVENCWCEEPRTAAALGLYCSMLSDCGPGKNYIGKYVNEGYEIIIGKEGKEENSEETESAAASPSAQPVFSGSQQTTATFPQGAAEQEAQAAASGQVIKELIGGIFGKQ